MAKKYDYVIVGQGSQDQQWHGSYFQKKSFIILDSEIKEFCI